MISFTKAKAFFCFLVASRRRAAARGDRERQHDLQHGRPPGPAGGRGHGGGRGARGARGRPHRFGHLLSRRGVGVQLRLRAIREARGLRDHRGRQHREGGHFEAF